MTCVKQQTHVAAQLTVKSESLWVVQVKQEAACGKVDGLMHEIAQLQDSACILQVSCQLLTD